MSNGTLIQLNLELNSCSESLFFIWKWYDSIYCIYILYGDMMWDDDEWWWWWWWWMMDHCDADGDGATGAGAWWRCCCWWRWWWRCCSWHSVERKEWSQEWTLPLEFGESLLITPPAFWFQSRTPFFQNQLPCFSGMIFRNQKHAVVDIPVLQINSDTKTSNCIPCDTPEWGPELRYWPSLFVQDQAAGAGLKRFLGGSLGEASIEV